MTPLQNCLLAQASTSLRCGPLSRTSKTLVKAREMSAGSIGWRSHLHSRHRALSPETPYPPPHRLSCPVARIEGRSPRSEEHTSQIQSPDHIVFPLLPLK